MNRRASPERPDWIWHDVEELLRNEHDVDDDTFKGSAKAIYNLFLAHGWRPTLTADQLDAWLLACVNDPSIVTPHEMGWMPDGTRRFPDAPLAAP